MKRLITFSQNYPNPFNPMTNIHFSLPAISDISLAIYDLQGRQVRQMFRGRKTSGDHTVQWDGTDNEGNRVASGFTTTV